MPRYLAKHLPGTTEEQRATLFGSIVSIVALDPADPIRVGAIQAYSDTMKILIIASLVFGSSYSLVLCWNPSMLRYI